MRQMGRLRWQLTFSHLKAIGFTLVCMIAAVLLLSAAWWTRTTNPSLRPADDARYLASTIQGLVVADPHNPTEVSHVLSLIASGNLRVITGPPQNSPDEAQFHAPINSALTDIAYLAVVGADRQLLGSSDPSGGGFAPPERSEWTPLVDAALNGANDPNLLVATRSGQGPVALSAYPIVDPSGQRVAAALVAKSAIAPHTSWFDSWGALLFFGAAAVVVLAGASVFALASSSLLSYLLAHRLVRRLERLGSAAEGFAAGDLSQRVDVKADGASDDEVSQLATRFNSMADRLSDTLAELAAEKQTVEDSLHAKRELVANVSHELRTPLASIRGHVESLLLRPDGDADNRRDYLEVIHRQSEQLSHLIDDLFLLSTSEAGALMLTTRPVALPEVISEVMNSIQPAARAERRVSLVSQVGPDLPPVLADRQRVGQVLANLVRNAVRHTPEGGLVAVRAFRRDAD